METCFIFWDFSRSECAAWVQAWAGISQALGALLAVGLTIFLWRSDKRSLKQQARSDTLQLSALIAVEAQGIFDYCQTGMETGYTHRQLQCLRLAEQIRYASAIQLTALPADAAILLVSLIASARRVHLELERFIDNCTINSEHMQSTLREATEAIQQTERNLRQALLAPLN